MSLDFAAIILCTWGVWEGDIKEMEFQRVCIYNGILHSHKKEILPFAATWMDLEGMMLKWNKLDREKQILCDVTYMWNLKSNIKKTKLTSTENSMMICKRMVGDMGEGGQGIQTSTYNKPCECHLQHGDYSVVVDTWKLPGE